MKRTEGELIWWCTDRGQWRFCVHNLQRPSARHSLALFHLNLTKTPYYYSHLRDEKTKVRRDQMSCFKSHTYQVVKAKENLHNWVPTMSQLQGTAEEKTNGAMKCWVGVGGEVCRYSQRSRDSLLRKQRQRLQPRFRSHEKLLEGRGVWASWTQHINWCLVRKSCWRPRGIRKFICAGF